MLVHGLVRLQLGGTVSFRHTCVVIQVTYNVLVGPNVPRFDPCDYEEKLVNLYTVLCNL